MFKSRKLSKYFYLQPLVLLFFSILFFVFLVVSLVYFFAYKVDNNILITVFALFFFLFTYWFFSFNKYYELIAKYYKSNFIYNFLCKQRKMLFFGLIYFFKNKENIITESSQIFYGINLNDIFVLNNQFSNEYIYVRKMMKIMVIIVCLTVIIGSICNLLISDKVFSVNLSTSSLFGFLYGISALVLFLLCWIYQIITTYHLYQQKFVSKNVFIISCVPIANLFYFALL